MTSLRKSSTFISAMIVAAAAGGVAKADPGSLTVNVGKPGITISPKLYGLMTEEINHSYDGGLYAELIQNRAFLDNRETPAHWNPVQHGTADCGISLSHENALSAARPVSLVIKSSTAAPNARAGAANSGYWGIPVCPNTKYRVSFYARAEGSYGGTITAAIESNNGEPVASAETGKLSSGWKKYTLTITTGNATAGTANRFALLLNSAGGVAVTEVSLFPPTFNNRANGNRKDLMKLMGDMKPAFLRLPGGNYLEGDTFKDRFAWKNTIGPTIDRAGHQCPWGYRSSDGLGLLEYLEWCEDLKMEPILAVFAGYTLNGSHVPAGPELDPYVEEALEEIEYVTGDVNTKWGAQRAKDGHPAPFPLEYIEIGNEDWFDRSGSYDGRFAAFYDAIRKKYPQYKLIATAPVKSRVPDVIDDHYYRTAADMERDVHHYDNYSRSGPKIFVGEWASTEGSPTPNLKAALGDAAWMTGMERNSDIIPIECYAPLLVNVNRGASQWGTNLIGYDALKSFGSPSYYVQAMFSKNRGDVVLPVDIKAQPAPPPPAPKQPVGAVGVGSWNTSVEYSDFEITQNGKPVAGVNPAAKDAWKLGNGSWKQNGNMLVQSSQDVDCRAVIGDPKWTDYTFHVKARKVAGAEGFLIMFHVKDEQNFLWWNIGGWGNSRTIIEKAQDGSKHEVGRVSDFKVETGRLYDIKVTVSGQNIKCYIDDNLITETQDTSRRVVVDPLYSTASRDLATGDIIVKVVNVSEAAQQLKVSLPGATGIGSTATAEIISGDPGDVNTVAAPTHVAPRKEKVTGVSAEFMHTFPAHSVTILRIKAAK
jgi:alpha-L-arabinofuranosidase